MLQKIKHDILLYKIQLLAGFASALCAHLFALVQVLHNYDNIAVVPSGYGTGITSGRWFLTIFGDFIGKIWGNYNIPFYNGFITIGILLIAACIVLDIFEIKDVKTGAVWTSIFVCFPTVTSTLFFMYTAPYYAFAILMAVMAGWVTEKLRYGWLLSMVLQACSLGIYQAYFPMTVTLFVLLLISKILEKDSSIQKILINGLAYLANLSGGMIAYFLLLKISLAYYEKDLNTYQGIDAMGKLKMSELPSLFAKTFIQFLTIPLKNYHGIASTAILKYAMIFLAVFSIGAVLALLFLNRQKPSIYAGTMGLCLIFPLAVNCIQIMCADSNIYTLMVYAAVFIYLMPLLLVEKLEKLTINKLFWHIDPGGIGRIVIAVYGVVLLNYIWLSNGNYTSMYYMNRQTENYLTTVITRIQETDHFHDSYQWVFIGKSISDPNFQYSWSSYTPYLYGGNITMLINAYSRNSFIRNFQGFTMPLADPETAERISKEDFVKKMPCYPSDGAIKVYEDLVIIKFEEVE